MNQATAPAEERFAALVEAMKEWLSLEPGSNVEWLSLATEAMDFVAEKR